MERKWWTLLAVCVATFMLLLDITIVNVALPSIQRDLERQPGQPSMGRRCLRAHPCLVPARLRLARRPPGPQADLLDRLRRLHGRVPALRPGQRSHRPEPLPRAPGGGRGGDVRDLPRADRPGVRGQRARQRDRRSGARRSEERWRSDRWSAGCSPTALGWEWIFFVNVPIGVGAIILTETRLANVAATDVQPIDWPGLASFSLALFALIFGLIRGNSEGWAKSADPRLADRRGRADGRLRRDRDAPRERDAGPRPVPCSVVRWRLNRRLGPVGEHVRDVPLPDALRPGRAGFLAAPGGASIPPDDFSVLRGGPDRWTAPEALARPDAARVGTDPRRASASC